jgi:hypothetical protein
MHLFELQARVIRILSKETNRDPSSRPCDALQGPPRQDS